MRSLRLLAFDIGEKRIGIASGDSSTGVSTPVAVLPPNEILNKSKNFQEILDDYMPDKFVFGRPVSMNGQAQHQAKRVEEVALQIAEKYCMPYDFTDERLSSSEAKRILREQGLTEKQMRGKIDSVSASLFLETYLKSHFN